jgi:hypothetical protein
LLQAGLFWEVLFKGRGFPFSPHIACIADFIASLYARLHEMCGLQQLSAPGFQDQDPGLFYLDPDERDELAACLRNAGFLFHESAFTPSAT